MDCWMVIRCWKECSTPVGVFATRDEALHDARAKAGKLTGSLALASPWIAEVEYRIQEWKGGRAVFSSEVSVFPSGRGF